MIRRLEQEEGAALAMALAFIALFGLLIAAVLSFSETGFRAGRALRDHGEELAAVDAAVDGAINRARGDLDVGVEGYDATCFTPPAINGVTASVRCEGQDGSGEPSVVDDPASPQHAILTLGTGVGGEVGVTKLVDSAMNVTGSVFSNSTIDVTGALAASDEVQALGNCTGTVTGSSVRCANVGGGGANAADGVDPDYAKETETVPAARTVPACGSGWLVSFQPGTYNDAAALTDLMDGGCSKIFHFEPGNYYFHFDVASASHTWTISDAGATVVAGAPAGWSTGAGSAPTLSVPGSCDTDVNGVQWVFGGESRINVSGGRVELCPYAHADAQRIALYGLTTGTVAVSNATQPATTASSATFSPAANAATIDGSVATANIAAVSGGGSATATVNGFAGIPAGSIITAATLRVAHAESPIADVNQLRVTVTPATGTATQVNLTKQASLATESVDLLAQGVSPTADFTSVSVAHFVRAKSNKAVTATLDGMELVLTYETPQWEAQDGCLTQTPFTGSGAPCAILTTSGTATTFAAHGTVYAPLSAVDASLPTANGFHLARGVIARALRMSVPATFSQTNAPLRVPAGTDGPRADREVVLTALIDGVDRVRALVLFGDDGGDTPGETVTIEEWSVLR